jgi:hypothetical protein
MIRDTDAHSCITSSDGAAAEFQQLPGTSPQAGSRSIGFSGTRERRSNGDLITYAGDGHLSLRSSPLRSGSPTFDWVTIEWILLLAAAVILTIVAGENLTVGSTVWLPAESVAPGR